MEKVRIVGDINSGNYSAYKNDDTEPFVSIVGWKKFGLSAIRKMVGNYLVTQCGYSTTTNIPQHNIKPGRPDSDNRLHKICTVQDYIDGIDPDEKYRKSSTVR
ncbi:hypothetical protein AYJ08_05245 [Brevibacillus sp. SKDU10]|uniref:Uncharacterized protein n=1 Tax=Brevibacillus laterosporus TaxID=1465 RepID=A0A0F7EFL9_BRELA|nr:MULTISPECIES: hypothetical protein [Brevibacillus]AKF92655.1 hypothetical protein EX87_02395 [Brevibacillus laterosporus]MBA4535543.1 hypothetical protein [Brevibacillus halotolerans]OAJ75295.1 hypothetical protein AYJ08_05245 [Brevibacillus sp. SKDU10]